MNLVTPTELARVITEAQGEKFTKQAAHKAVKEGVIPHVLKGKRKMVDLDDTDVQNYIQGDNRQREAVKKKDVKPAKKTAKRSKKKTASRTKQYNLTPIEDSETEELTDHQIKRRTNIAKMKKAQLENEIMQKKYLPVEFIDRNYIAYLEKLHTTLERGSAVFIHEVGKAILSSGEVLPEHIEKFNSMVLEAIHNNKKSVKKGYKKYDPKS